MNGIKIVLPSVLLSLVFWSCNTTKPSEKVGTKRGNSDGSAYKITFSLPHSSQPGSTAGPSGFENDNFETFLTDGDDPATVEKGTGDWGLVDAVIFRLIADKADCARYQVYTIDAYRPSYSMPVDPSCDYKLAVKIGTESAESSPNNLQFVAFYETEASVLITGSEIKEKGEFVVPMRLKLTAAGTNFGFEKEWVNSGDSVNGTDGQNGQNGQNGNLGGDLKLTYEELKPIVDAKCASCHNPQGSRATSDLSTFNGFKAYGAESVRRVASANMPLGSSLTSEEKQKFQQWSDDGMLEKNIPNTDSTDGTTDSNDPNVVTFRIAAGTGSGAWNTQDKKVQVKVGQTLKIINDDSMQHQLHTDGAPCPHGSPIPPGGTFECKISRPYNGAGLRDHSTYGAFYLEATQ